MRDLILRGRFDSQILPNSKIYWMIKFFQQQYLIEHVAYSFKTFKNSVKSANQNSS